MLNPSGSFEVFEPNIFKKKRYLRRGREDKHKGGLSLILKGPRQVDRHGNAEESIKQLKARRYFKIFERGRANTYESSVGILKSPKQEDRHVV
jgi:hypothetical protein